MSDRPPPDAEKSARPSLMSYGLFILVGCSLCASLVGSLL
jgi:hypothetical protein